MAPEGPTNDSPAARGMKTRGKKEVSTQHYRPWRGISVNLSELVIDNISQSDCL